MIINIISIIIKIFIFAIIFYRLLFFNEYTRNNGDFIFAQFKNKYYQFISE